MIAHPLSRRLGLALLLASLCSARSFANLDSSLRLKALPLLIPNDPENYLLEQLPEVDLTVTAKLNAHFESKKMDSAADEVTWQGLAINYLLQQDYKKALQCLELANNEAEEELPYYLGFKSYALQQSGRINDAIYMWEQQINEQEDNRPVLTQLISCNLFQRKIMAAEALASILPEDREDESITQYLQAVLDLSRGDLFVAQQKLLHIIKTPNPPKEAYLALAISSMERGGEYDVVGWLRVMFRKVPTYQQHLIANHPSFASLRDHPAFIELLEEFHISTSGETEELTPPLLASYEEKFQIPKTLRINLKLNVLQEEVPPQFLGLKLVGEKKDRDQKR